MNCEPPLKSIYDWICYSSDANGQSDFQKYSDPNGGEFKGDESHGRK